MKKIYIVLSYTGTILSKLIKVRTSEKYCHVSIAFDEELEEMYSFGRLNPYNAFFGGFVTEGKNFGTFKRFKNTQIALYRLEVTDGQYYDLENIIKNIKTNKQEYKYNIKGLALAGINKGKSREDRFYCAEFVKYVLAKANIDVEDLPRVVKPGDFKNLRDAQLVYESYLKHYR